MTTNKKLRSGYFEESASASLQEFWNSIRFDRRLLREDIEGSLAHAAMLQACGVDRFFSVNVLADDAIRQGIKDYASWPTIPQLYVNGEFVGGCDIMREMYESGELQQLLSRQAA